MDKSSQAIIIIMIMVLKQQNNYTCPGDIYASFAKNK